MNEDETSSLGLLLEGDFACFRRPEFATDFVSYDMLPPLHAERLLSRCVDDAGGWAISRIRVLSPLQWDWHTIATPRGQRRAFGLWQVRYFMELRSLTQSPRHLMLRKEPVHLGLAEYPAKVTIRSSAHDAVPLGDLSLDLGWMPVATAPMPPRTTIYQRLQLRDGILDLSAQDTALRAQ